ncbi:glycosyl hydrolase [Gordonia sp. ABSL11-1]|uniref:glycoside hydrolase family 26 protein n=1 Tax=Gordonia sp. ABSL11-1 TaxID=3053924 RepID=UPI002572C2EC|nr:glycosyl hydrolase [Gordonia sp. ABSL11-1]MDL9948715.1 glycosyl hydrolase [Gordonia sp. ABSL11-1]
MTLSLERAASRALTRRAALRLAALGTLAAGTTAACAPGDDLATDHPTWGAFIPSVLPTPGSSRSPMHQLTILAGTRPGYLHRFAAIGDSAPVAELTAIADAGATPLLTLEPWIAGRGIDQPSHALRRVASGAFDADLRRWGAELAAWGRPVLLRFAQEMNGTWYPWSIGVNGNSAADYRQAWMRMRRQIRAAAADQVQFVWAPNVITEGTNDFAAAYPGSDHVDLVALDGYNWGTVPGHHWQSADNLFTASLAALRRLDTTHPILITEVASAEGNAPDDKANWIRDFFAIVQREPRLESFLWFQTDKERDWRFNSTPASLAAFRTSLSSMQSQQ